MAEKAKYKTKQSEEMLNFLRTTNSKHFTAADVCRYFKDNSIPVGTTTVYRRLEQLVSEGKVKKYLIDETSCACFEYIGDSEERDYPNCYHLKCEECGRLIHLECDEITEFERHITKHHGFKINPMRTTFYGICNECLAIVG
ncbi:MAG: transcriptional repressor [Lachnospiraceae bacterium]|nr:transcriptional repressor [Lachnospiraceae bacterium]